MDTEKLKALKNILETGSISSSAEILGYSEPGLSGSIKRLEKEIGYPILKRTSKGVVLTPAGESLLPYIEKLLKASEELEHAIERFGPGNENLLRIGSYTSISKNLLPGILKRYHEKYPDIRIETKDGTLMEIESWLKTGSIDVGLISKVYTSKLEFYPFATDKVCAVLPPGEPVKDYVDISYFEGKPFFIPANGADTEIRGILKRNHVQPAFSSILTDNTAITKMVEQGIGYSILTELMLEDCISTATIAPIRPETNRILGAAVKSFKETSAAAKNFIRLIQL